MAEGGILGTDTRVELIKGEIYDVTPAGSAHMALVNRLNKMLIRAVGDQAIVSVQNPVIIGEHSCPEPDLCLLNPRDDDYIDSIPNAADCLLVVEVAASSLPFDREIKNALYAEHGIPEVWLVDVRGLQLTRYADPQDQVWRHEDQFDWNALGELVEFQALPGVSVDLAGLFAGLQNQR